MNKQNTIAVLEIMHTKAREIKRKLEADERDASNKPLDITLNPKREEQND